MHSEYFNVRFRSDKVISDWPEEFVIITAHATTGEKWTDDENESAGRELEGVLKSKCNWVESVTGFSPDTLHAEPGWAATIPFNEACDIGNRFKQDAIYFIKDDELFVSHCDERRELVKVGVFSDFVVL